MALATKTPGPQLFVMVINLKRLFLFLFLTLPFSASAGDYSLTIADDMNSPCTEKVKKIHEWCRSQRDKGIECRIEESWPLKTSDEVIESIKIYFSGGNPPIKILLGAFSNGHLEFCTEKEKRIVYDALVSIKKRGEYKHGRHIDDFINILGIKETP